MKTGTEVAKELDSLVDKPDTRFWQGVEYALNWVLEDYHIPPSESDK